MAYSPTPVHVQPPKLVLHIEADTLAELMDAMDAVMVNLAPGQLGQVHYSQPPAAPAAEVEIHSADAPADTTAKKRGRPPKAATEANTLAPTVPLEGAPTPAPDAAEMVSLTPAAARDKGIAMVQQHFALHPNSVPQIQAISKKYGVPHFAAIPDDQAHAFLADIVMLTNGSGEV